MFWDLIFYFIFESWFLKFNPKQNESPTKKAASENSQNCEKTASYNRSGFVRLFFILACTGLLLGWKKHTGGIILPKSHQGSSTDMKDWLPVDDLHKRAVAVVREQISAEMSPELERIDFRPDKGMVKFVFVEDYWGVQLDCATGELLHIERRRSDFIENIHDGSILDYLTGTDGEQIKLFYTTLMGSALLLFTITGFWLWYGPKQFKKSNKL